MGITNRTAPTAQEYEGFRKKFSNWGRWGQDDQLGTLNHITPEVRQKAAALARAGRTVSCARPLAKTPGPRNPNPAQHFMRVTPMGSSDYIGVSYHGYANTHLDALCHMYSADSQLYNGHPISDVTSMGALNCSVDHWRSGIVTRGVLYDIPRLRSVAHITLESPVHGWELEDAAKAQGVEPRPGDAVLIRGGAAPFYAANPNITISDAPGVHASVIEFLYGHSAALLGWDFIEQPNQPYPVALPVHRLVIPYMGMPLLDNGEFEDLAKTCAELGRWEFLFVIAPLIVEGGTGSPVNPVAIF